MFGWRKTISGKYIFSRNANFRKRKMFPWCLVAFQKIFRKIFSGVWKRRRKTQMKGKTQATTQEKINDDTEHRPTTAPSIAIDGAIMISPSSRDRDLREFAPSITISIRCDLAKARSRSTARSRSSRDRAVDRDLDPLREIAINGVARS